MTVGFFDSGVGGISVLEKAAVQLKYNKFLFYADSAHVPYGVKTREEIIDYVDHAVAFLHEQGAEIVVLACNTATSAAAEYLRNKYSFPILGMEPAVKVASKTLDANSDKKIIVTATELTLKLKKFEKLVHQLDINESVETCSLQKLVEFAENGDFDGPEVKKYLRNRLSSLEKNKISALVLGCTHFTFFKTLINDIMYELLGYHVPIIDGNEGTVNYLETLVKKNDFSEEKPLKERIRIFESDQEVPCEKYLNLLQRAHIENAGGY